MAYNYLSLANDVCRRLNEVELNSSNFATAIGQYGHIKDAVNYAIRDINQDEYEWPFNYVVHTETLVAGQARYSFPADFKTCSMDTFRIQRNPSFGNETKLLRPMQYEEYLEKFIDQEYNTSDEGIREVPSIVSRAPNLEYCLAKVPDEAYSLTYEYYSLPTDLEAYDDTPTIPVQFRKTIVDAAMFYTYMFRGDLENSQLTRQKYDDGLKVMRSIYINRYDYIKSTMIERGGRHSTHRID